MTNDPLVKHHGPVLSAEREGMLTGAHRFTPILAKFGLGAIVGAGLGAAGLMNSKQQGDRQANLMQQGLDAGKYTQEAQHKMMGIADNYNPMLEGQAAADSANASAADALQKGLKKLRATYGGSDPTGDTEFRVRSQDIFNRSIDPLREFIANLRANMSMQKLGAYQAVAGVPVGQMASNYFQAAGMMNSDPTASLGMLGNALQKAFAGGGGAAGAIGGSSAAPADGAPVTPRFT